ncbi:MAG: ATP-binding protein [Pseudomonadota bacterium]
MFWIDWVAVVMVGVGALFMLLSILLAVAMLPRLTPFYKRKWAILTVFKGFFLLGYLAFIVILVMELKLPVEFVTGVIFLGGAFFVFMVIRLTKYTITDLSNKEDALNNLNATLENKVSQRTIELEKSMADLGNEILEREKANNEIRRMGEELQLVLDTISTGIRVVGPDHLVTRVNKRFCHLLGMSNDELVGSACYENFDNEDCRDSPSCRLKNITTAHDDNELTVKKTTREGKQYHFRITSAPLKDTKGQVIALLEDFQDITPLIKAQEEKELAQSRLHQAAKLESVGQLAAGIAHEINTPVQFVGTNLEFLKESFEDIATFLEKLQVTMNDEESTAGLKQGLEELDWDFISEEIPLAIEQSMGGTERVRKLVLAMKEFSHPTTKEMAPANINTILHNTIIISQNEWKHVADMETKLSEDLPLVPCLIDAMGQVFLNIIVNAAHAIKDKVKDTSEKGTITITTALDGDAAQISFRDTGTGMDEELCSKIFDPFFTTKEVGSGTGQGLSIAHDIVVNKHHGAIKVETSVGVGTCFIVQLPLQAVEN